jgi:NitT/TauT family transport system permease protein
MSVTTGEAVPPPPVRTGRRALSAPPYAVLTLLALLLVWQAATSWLHVASYLLPSPLAIVAELVGQWQLLLAQTWITTYEVVLGFLLSIAFGVPLAVLLARSPVMERALYPLIVGSQTIPKVAIAPVLLAWLGFGLKPKIVIVVLVTFFPIVINSVVGLKSLSTQMLSLARSMGASPWQVFVHFQLPNALPAIFGGMKIATALAIIGAVVAEFVGADGGLGYVIMVAASDLAIARQFAAIVLLTILGMIFFAVIERVERLCLPWHVSVRTRDE